MRASTNMSLVPDEATSIGISPVAFLSTLVSTPGTIVQPILNITALKGRLNSQDVTTAPVADIVSSPVLTNK